MGRPKKKKPGVVASPSAPAPPPVRRVVNLDDVPGLKEHLAGVRREQTRLRELAMLGIPIPLCGVEVEQYKPRHRQILIASGNPLVAGGEAGAEALLQFLWVVSTSFDASNPEAAAQFAASLQLEESEIADCVADVWQYIDDAFMDQRPNTAGGVPVSGACLTAQLYHEFYTAIGWDEERVRETPFGALFQRLRLMDSASYAAAGKQPPPPFSREDAARREYVKLWEQGLI